MEIEGEQLKYLNIVVIKACLWFIYEENKRFANKCLADKCKKDIPLNYFKWAKKGRKGKSLTWGKKDLIENLKTYFLALVCMSVHSCCPRGPHGPENQGTVMFIKRKKNSELSSTMLNETRDSSDETGD